MYVQTIWMEMIRYVEQQLSQKGKVTRNKI